MSALVTKALKDKSRNLSISRECAEMEKKTKQTKEKKNLQFDTVRVQTQSEPYYFRKSYTFLFSHIIK